MSKMNQIQILGILTILIGAISLGFILFGNNDNKNIVINTLLSFSALSISMALIISGANTRRNVQPIQTGDEGDSCDLTGKSDVMVCNDGLDCVKHSESDKLGICKNQNKTSAPTDQQ